MISKETQEQFRTQYTSQLHRFYPSLFPNELKQANRESKRAWKGEKKARQLAIVADRVKKHLAASKHGYNAHSYSVLPTSTSMVYIAFDQQQAAREPEQIVRKEEAALEIESDRSSVRSLPEADDDQDFGEFVEEDAGQGEEEDFAAAYSDNY